MRDVFLGRGRVEEAWEDGGTCRGLHLLNSSKGCSGSHLAPLLLCRIGLGKKSKKEGTHGGEGGRDS